MENKLPKIWLLAIVMVLSCLVPVKGATFTATQDGNWDAPATWGGAGVPNITDTADLDQYEVKIPLNFVAEVWKIDLTHADSYLVMELGSTLLFNGSTAGNGFIGTTNGNITCNGAVGTPVNISVKGGTQDWEYDASNIGAWDAEYTTLEYVDGGTDFRSIGLIQWDNVNVSHSTNYMYVNQINDGTYFRNIRFDTCASSCMYSADNRGDLGLNIEYNNMVFSNTFLFRQSRQTNFTDITINDEDFVHYQLHAQNVTVKNLIMTDAGGIVNLAGYANCYGDIFFDNMTSAGDIALEDNTYIITPVPYEMYFNYSSYRTFMDTINANMSYLYNNSLMVFLHDQKVLNDWKFYAGHYQDTESIVTYNVIDTDFKILKEYDVTIAQDFLYVDEDINMQSINVSNAEPGNIPYYDVGYEVLDGTTTTGIYAYNITGNVYITNGSFMNFTYSDWANARADFFNASNISLVDWITLPAGTTGYAINVTNTTETINFSLRLYDSVTSDLVRWDGASWVIVPSTYNGVYHEALGLTTPGLYATDWTPTSNITGINNTKYPYSINIRYNFSTDFATSCWYTYNKGKINISFPCSQDYVQFDVPFDTTYVLEVFSENAGVQDVDRISFEVERNMQGGIIWTAIIGVFGAIASFFLFAGISMDKKHLPLQMFFLGTSFWMGVNTLHAGVLGAREYLKTPLTTDTLMMIYNIGFWLFFAVFVIIILTVLYNSLLAIKEEKNEL